MALAAAIGIAARLRAYLGGRSLWYDELLLTSNIVERTWLGLTLPLHSNQSAPILFLWLEHAAALLFGPNELALRALPLLSGLALPLGIWFFGPAIVEAEDARFAAILAFLSPPLIYYSDEVKQYGVDAFVTFALVALICWLLASPGRLARWVGVTVAGVVAMALSQPAVFTLASAGVALLVSPGVRRSDGGIRRTAALALVWCVVFGVLYLTIYRAAAHNPNLVRFWSSTFLEPEAPDFRLRLDDLVHDALASPLPAPLTPIPLTLAVLAFVAGAARAARVRGLAVATLLLLPLPALAAASALAKYPVATRLLLCLAPLAFLAYGSLFGWIAASVPQNARSAVNGLAAGAILIAGAGRALDVIAEPPPRGVWSNCPPCMEETKPLIREVDRLAHGDPVYLIWRMRPSWWFYETYRASTRPGDPPGTLDTSRVFIGAEPRVGLDTAHARIEPMPGPDWAHGEAMRLASIARPNVWLLASHIGDSAITGVVDAARERGAHVVYAHVEPGAGLFKLRFSRGSP